MDNLFPDVQALQVVLVMSLRIVERCGYSVQPGHIHRPEVRFKNYNIIIIIILLKLYCLCEGAPSC